MVQLWPGIPPEVLCDMYLNSCLNEGLNLLIRHHMAKGHRIDGWIRNGCVDLEMLHVRIPELIAEAKKRGKSWNYQYTEEDDGNVFTYDAMAAINNDPVKSKAAITANPAKLAAKCLACRYRETRCKGKETCVERFKAKGMI
jgi:hypothetical protein